MVEMTQRQMPPGTTAYIGHPANECLIVKTSGEFWRYVDTGSIVNDEAFRAGWSLYIPEELITLLLSP